VLVTVLRVYIYYNIEDILCYNNAITLLLRPVGRSGRRGGGRFGRRRSGRTGSLYGFLFSVPGNLEGLGQVQGGLVQRQAMDRSPQIQHVPLDRTLSVKALKGVLAGCDRASAKDFHEIRAVFTRGVA